LRRAFLYEFSASFYAFNKNASKKYKKRRKERNMLARKANF